MVELLYLQEPAEGVEVREAPLSMLLPMWALVIACVWFGLDTDLTSGAALSAANSLIAGGR